MNNTVKYIAPTAPEKSLAELLKVAGENIEQSTQALVGIAAALLEQLKDVQTKAAADNEPASISPLYMTVTQALERYSIGRNTFYQITQLDGCPKLGRIGNKIMIPIAAFDEFFYSLVMEGKADELQ
ncbi:MAG: hypothetical protein IKL10_04880 [Clostridia bacterium]|nr:hypothetical protein [Clostridia bacterium]